MRITNFEYMQSVGINAIFDANIDFDAELNDEMKEFFDLLASTFEQIFNDESEEE